MSIQPKPIKESVVGLNNEEIQRLINERLNAGATSCKVVQEGNHKFLVTEWPPA